MESQVDTKPHDAFTFSETGITPSGPVTKQLVQNDVLPRFHQNMMFWLQSCAYWWLEDFNQAWAVQLPQFQHVDVVNAASWHWTRTSFVSNLVQADGFFGQHASTTLLSEMQAPRMVELTFRGPPFRAQAMIGNPVSHGHLHVAERRGVPLHHVSTAMGPTMVFRHPV
ncbi:hypothetical protein PsorP6_014758 [Peronosclerospora sorghi]|uniref:Uncharacterized protein n=1 Tax=Peronosclerospora sorghi TaxID=230839 RepID=A0ACC0VRX8_9STRA|nr:hypothetical protein PsorP6_014758 [Peronosclerospora sorghi]